MKKEKHGGKREGSGRKSLSPENKKVLMALYIRQSDIDQLGGYEQLQKKLYLIIEGALIEDLNKY